MRQFLLLLISIIEGACLIGVELTGSKKIAVFFGSSLIVWTSVFVITLLGLMVGYRLGGNLSLKKDLDKILFKVLFGTLLYYAITLLLTNAILSNFVHFSLIVGSVLSCLILLFPMCLLFGLVSPILIKLLSKDESEIGKNTGFIYTISTLGGVCLSLISGLYLIPDFGLKITSFIILGLIAVIVLASFYNLKMKND